VSAEYRRPESVLVLVYTRAGDVLLIKRRRPANFWQSVTGTLEKGEVAADAAVRELAEETGITGVKLVDCKYSREFVISPDWRHRYAPGVEKNTESVFLCELESRPETIELASDEHSDYLWLPLAQAIEKVWSYTNRDALVRFLDSDIGQNSG